MNDGALLGSLAYEKMGALLTGDGSAKASQATPSHHERTRDKRSASIALSQPWAPDSAGQSELDQPRAFQLNFQLLHGAPGTSLVAETGICAIWVRLSENALATPLAAKYNCVKA